MEDLEEYFVYVPATIEATIGYIIEATSEEDAVERFRKNPPDTYGYDDIGIEWINTVHLDSPDIYATK